MPAGEIPAMSDDVQSAPAASGGTTNWFPVFGAIGLAVVVGLGLLGSYAIVLYKLRSSPAGREAHVQIVENAQLKQLLGEPLGVKIEAGDLAHEGQAAFTMRVRGARGSAMVEMSSQFEQHRWRIVSGTVTLADGTERTLEVGAPTAIAPEVRLALDAGPQLADAGPD